MRSKYLLVLLIWSSLAYGFESFEVKDVQFEGLTKVSVGVVEEKLDNIVGSKLDESRSEDLISNLYATGYFKQVDLKRLDSTLVIHFVERPTIVEVDIKGVKDTQELRKILDSIDVRRGRIYQESKLALLKQMLLSHYYSQRKYNAKVDVEVIALDENKVKLSIDIYATPDAKVKEIRFIGNKVFPAAILKKQLLQRPTLLSFIKKNDIYLKEKMAADLENLTSFYLNRGYINFQIVKNQVSLSVDKKHVFITITVSEGEKYDFGTLDVTGDTGLLATDTISTSKAKLASQKHFSRELIVDTKAYILKELGDIGYAFADVKISTEVDEANKLVNIGFHVDAKQRAYVRRVNIAGNYYTKDEVLRREIPQLEGSWLIAADVAEGRETIMREGYATKVDLDVKKISDDTVDVSYNIEENKQTRLSASFGYSKQESYMITLAAQLNNFVGTGKNIDIVFEHTDIRKNYTFGYQDPYFIQKGIGLGYNLYKRETNLSRISRISEFTDDSYGAFLSLILKLTRKNTLTFGLGYDHTDIKLRTTAFSLSDEVSAFRDIYGLSFNEFTIVSSWRRNDLDKHVFPTQGAYYVLTAKTTVPGSTLEYYQLLADIKYYFPIVKNSGFVFSVGSKLGYGNGYRNTDRLPFFRHFYAGGSDSVRGFEERSLGPKDSNGLDFGGNAKLVGNLEFIFPFPVKSAREVVRSYVFLDAGQVYNLKTGTTSANSNESVRFSAGVGLLWRTPLNIPIEFTFGWPLNAGPTDRRSAPSFNFATTLH